MKTIQLSQYFKITHPTYTILRLIPDKSIRNYNSSNIANTINSLYRDIKKRIRKDKKTWNIETPLKCSFYIDIKKNGVDFYFIIPDAYMSLFQEKITETWSRITIQTVDNIPNFSKDVLRYYLHYKYEDALSLKVDKKCNEPLNSILNVLNIIEKDDRVGVLYNFMPTSQLNWHKKYNRTMQRIKAGESILNEVISPSYIIKFILTTLSEIIQGFTEGVGELFDTKRNKKNGLLENLIERLTVNNKKELSQFTRKKKDSTILNTQIVIQSDSNNIDRRYNNALAITGAFQSIADDNELKSKKFHANSINYTNFKLSNVPINKVSIDECQNFLQLPARDLLERHKCIQQIDILENPLSEELQEGYIRLGKNYYKGDIKMAYMSNDKNLANLGLVVMGQQGSGKSEYLKNYANDVIKSNENLIVLDFIKNCELSNDIETIVPQEKLLVIDMAKEQDLQGFGYNEIKFKENMTDFELLETANLIAQQDMALIDAINADGSPLTSRMRRYLSASANIVHLHENKSLRDVINVLQDHNKRHKAIDNIDSNLKQYLEDEVNALQELDEIKESKDKDTKTSTFEVVGTKDSKIEHILDRINLLKEDFKLKFMFNKTLENNIDFVEELEKGKTILIKIPEHKYPLKYVKNVIVTYFTTKIWLASQIRGKMHDKPLRTHVLLDEIFQAPTSENMLRDILPQCRKFQLKFVISAHYLSQIETIREALKASGASYMLLQGTDKKNYKELEEELQPFQLEDLLNLKRFHSLNLIKTVNGYAKFITKLPKPIK